jgi:hypothetical protein
MAGLSTKPNYEYLKRLHSSTINTKEMLKKEYERMFRTQEEKELEKCTFKPQINTKKAYKTTVDFQER